MLAASQSLFDPIIVCFEHTEIFSDFFFRLKKIVLFKCSDIHWILKKQNLTKQKKNPASLELIEICAPKHCTDLHMRGVQLLPCSGNRTVSMVKMYFYGLQTDCIHLCFTTEGRKTTLVSILLRHWS